MRGAVRLLAVLVLAGTAAHAGSSETLLGQALDAHELDLVALITLPAYGVPRERVEGCPATSVRVCVRSRKILSPEKAQTAAELVREGVEALELPECVGVGVYLYASFSEPPAALLGGYPSGPFCWEPGPAEGGAGQGVLTARAEKLPLGHAIAWYAGSVCYRPCTIDRSTHNALIGVAPWQRLDLRCEANEKRPARGNSVSGHPVLTESLVSTRPARMAEGSDLLDATDLNLHALHVQTCTRFSGVAVARMAGVMFTQEGEPLGRDRFETLARGVRETIEEWSVPGLGAVTVEGYEPHHLATAESKRIGVQFVEDEGHRRGTRFEVGDAFFPSEAEPVAWFGHWLWHRRLDFSNASTRRARFAGAGAWASLAWWASGNRIPPSDPAAVIRHAPAWVVGRPAR